MKKDKKGISIIMGISILIFMISITFGILYLVTNKFIQKDEQMTQQKLKEENISLQIKNVYVEDDKLKVKVKQISGNETLGIEFIISDGINVKTITNMTPLTKLEQKIFEFNLSSLNLTNLKYVSVSPIYLSEDSKEKRGSVSRFGDKWEVEKNYECLIDSDCEKDYVCEDTSCIPNYCESHSSKACYDGDVYWYDSCGVKEGIYDDCSVREICTDRVCINNCSSHNLSLCHNGNVYWYDSCGFIESAKENCSENETCSNGVCVESTDNCSSHNLSLCHNGNVYWYDSCGFIESIKEECGADYCNSFGTNYCYNGNVYHSRTCYDKGCLDGICFSTLSTDTQLIEECDSGEVCSSGVCVCTSHSSKACYDGDVYWYDSCGVKEGIYDDCSEGEVCEGGICKSSNPPTQDYIIIDHNSANYDFNNIPEYWINKAKTDLHIAYQHTSHGSQLITGMNSLKNFPSYGDKYKWSDDGSSGLDLDDIGIPGCNDLSQGDTIDTNGVTPWVTATRNLLDNPANSHVNVIMWSWCSINEHNAQRYVENMEILISEYPYVKFVFMTGHAQGQSENLYSDPDSNGDGHVHYNNEYIRNHVLVNGRILFDFADIEAYNPDGDYFWNLGLQDNLDYNEGNWGEEWINNNKGSILDKLTTGNGVSDFSGTSGCAHSNYPQEANLNCVLKGRAAWYMYTRLAGWDGN